MANANDERTRISDKHFHQRGDHAQALHQEMHQTGSELKLVPHGDNDWHPLDHPALALQRQLDHLSNWKEHCRIHQSYASVNAWKANVF